MPGSIDEIRRKQGRYHKVPFVPVWFQLSRWPWQYKTTSAWLDVGGRKVGTKWGWKINQGGMGRFGGGWNIQLGISIGRSTMLVYLIYGTIRFTMKDPAITAAEVKSAMERLDKLAADIRKKKEPDNDLSF